MLEQSTTVSRLLDLGEAARQLGISPMTVRRRVREGVMPHHRIGARILFSAADIQAYLDACAVPARGGEHAA